MRKVKGQTGNSLKKTGNMKNGKYNLFYDRLLIFLDFTVLRGSSLRVRCPGLVCHEEQLWKYEFSGTEIHTQEPTTTPVDEEGYFNYLLMNKTSSYSSDN
jgi:hypothetical protein